MKLRLVTERIGLKNSKIDPELCFKHLRRSSGSRQAEAGKEEWVLVCIMTKHVNDLNIAGRPEVVRQVLSELQKEFGELKVSWHNFVNCGAQHTQCPRTKSITLDQIVYAQNLRAIAHPQLTSGKAEDKAVPELHQLYMSLLGAVAYLSHTRVDVIVFICALQRHTSSPTIEHARKLNKLLRWIQRHPKKLRYAAFI